MAQRTLSLEERRLRKSLTDAAYRRAHPTTPEQKAHKNKLQRERRNRERLGEQEVAIRRYGTLRPEKKCVKCGIVKPLQEFDKLNYTTSTGKLSVHFASRCIPCRRQCDVERYWKDPEHHRRRVSEYGKANRDEITERRRPYLAAKKEHIGAQRRERYFRQLKERYGLTDAEVDRVRQGPKICDACGSDRKIVVDHDRVRKCFRGVLCHHCNLALGHLHDSAERAEQLARYIRERCNPRI